MPSDLDYFGRKRLVTEQKQHKDQPCLEKFEGDYLELD